MKTRFTVVLHDVAGDFHASAALLSDKAQIDRAKEFASMFGLRVEGCEEIKEGTPLFSLKINDDGNYWENDFLTNEEVIAAIGNTTKQQRAGIEKVLAGSAESYCYEDCGEEITLIAQSTE